MSKDITTQEELAERYVRAWQVRSIVGIVSGVIGIAGGIIALRQIRKDRRGARSQP